ncbi:MAG: hypothetical protein ABI541_13300 [Betaproteobacteria bacterium]
MNAVAEVANARVSWWLCLAIAYLTGAYAVVLIALGLAESGGNWLDTPAPVMVEGAQIDIMRGSGHREGNAVLIDAQDASGVAIVGSRLSPFPAAAYPRVEWTVKTTASIPPQLTFLWRTQEHRNKTFSAPVAWAGGNGGRVLPLELARAEGWSGTIVGIALAVRGPLASPLTISGVTVPGVSSLTSIQEVLHQWARSFPFRGNSIAFPFDEERDDRISFLVATVVAEGLAIAAYLLVVWKRRDRVDRRIIWSILIAGWLVTDARWQINLGRQLVHTAQTFAGKTAEEKHLAADDGRFFALMQQVNRALPAPPARIFLLADESAFRTRGAYFLYPHNVFHAVGEFKRLPDPTELSSGDFVLLFPTHGISYDRERLMLAWPDNRSRSVGELLRSDEGIVLLRIK